MVYRYSDGLAAFNEAVQSGQTVEIDDDMYWYWLEVLPPVRMYYNAPLKNGNTVRANFGFAEGAETIVAFWTVGSENYFACQTTEVNL